MKKLLTITATLLMVLVLVGCGQSAPKEEPAPQEEPVAEETVSVAGHTYEMTGYEANGVAEDLGSWAGQKLVFNEDGTYTLDAVTDEETGEEHPGQEGAFEEDGTTVKCTFEHWGETLTEEYAIEGDTLKFTESYPAVGEDGNETGENEEYVSIYTLVK